MIRNHLHFDIDNPDRRGYIPDITEFAERRIRQSARGDGIGDRWSLIRRETDADAVPPWRYIDVEGERAQLTLSIGEPDKVPAGGIIQIAVDGSSVQLNLPFDATAWAAAIHAEAEIHNPGTDAPTVTQIADTVFHITFAYVPVFDFEYELTQTYPEGEGSLRLAYATATHQTFELICKRAPYATTSSTAYFSPTQVALDVVPGNAERREKQRIVFDPPAFGGSFSLVRSTREIYDLQTRRTGASTSDKYLGGKYFIIFDNEGSVGVWFKLDAETMPTALNNVVSVVEVNGSDFDDAVASKAEITEIQCVAVDGLNYTRNDGFGKFIVLWEGADADPALDNAHVFWFKRGSATEPTAAATSEIGTAASITFYEVTLNADDTGSEVATALEAKIDDVFTGGTGSTSISGRTVTVSTAALAYDVRSALDKSPCTTTVTQNAGPGWDGVAFEANGETVAQVLANVLRREKGDQFEILTRAENDSLPKNTVRIKNVIGGPRAEPDMGDSEFSYTGRRQGKSDRLGTLPWNASGEAWESILGDGVEVVAKQPGAEYILRWREPGAQPQISVDANDLLAPIGWTATLWLDPDKLVYPFSETEKDYAKLVFEAQLAQVASLVAVSAVGAFTPALTYSPVLNGYGVRHQRDGYATYAGPNSYKLFYDEPNARWVLARTFSYYTYEDDKTTVTLVDDEHTWFSDGSTFPTTMTRAGNHTGNVTVGVAGEGGKPLTFCCEEIRVYRDVAP